MFRGLQASLSVHELKLTSPDDAIAVFVIHGSTHRAPAA